MTEVLMAQLGVLAGIVIFALIVGWVMMQAKGRKTTKKSRRASKSSRAKKTRTVARKKKPVKRKPARRKRR